MKKQFILVVALIGLFIGSVNAQEKAAKAEMTMQEEQSEIAVLLNSKNFEFIANTAYPQSMSPKDLVGNNYSVTFTPERIVSFMPFYGRSYKATASAHERAMNFEGSPEDYKLEQTKKGYLVTAKVTDENAIYTISMSVSDSGYATLNLSRNDSGAISYQGEVVSIKD